MTTSAIAWRPTSTLRAAAVSDVVVRELSADAWDDRVVTFPEHTVFHTSAWLDALAAVRGLRILRLEAEIDGRSAAVWPCLLWQRGPLRILGSPLPATATVYLGPLFRDDVDVSAAVGAFLDQPALRRYAYFGCRVLDRNRSVDLAPFGFAATRSFETYAIDLRPSEDELWRRLRSECRSRIRKATKLGIEVRTEETVEFLGDFWEMTRQTFRRSNGRPTHSRELVAELWSRLQPRGHLEVLSAFFRGERVATLFLPQDRKTKYYWAGASFDRHRGLPAGNLLHWEAIRSARARGLTSYDLDSTAGGPGRFKQSFGAEVVRTATHWERIPWRAVAAVKRRIERVRRPVAAGRSGL